MHLIAPLEVEEMFWSGMYESHIQRALLRTVRKEEVVFDCGTYIGFFTLMLANSVGKFGRVFAFEPDPASRETLIRNVRLNNFNNIIVLPYAVSDRMGTVPFIAEGKSTSRIPGTGRRDDEGPLTTVESITLDDFCARYNVTPDLKNRHRRCRRVGACWRKKGFENGASSYHL